jgi:hypothetical protein
MNKSILVIVIASIIVAGFLVYLYWPSSLICNKTVTFNACYTNSQVRLAIENLGERIDTMNLTFSQRNISLSNIPQGRTIYDLISNDTYSIYVKYKQASCEKKDIVPVQLCSAATNLSISLNLINTTAIPIEETPEIGSGTTRISCKPNWQCDDWEICESGVQKRDCRDTSGCLTANSTPEFTQACAECRENWQCSWSKCENGITTPDCMELNGCGTEYSKPTAISCPKEDCKPDISCTAWSQCNLDYSFTNLEILQGVRSRICTDNTGCANPVYQYNKCSLKVDVYIRESNNLLQVYNLNNKLVSKIAYAKNYLDVNLYI